MQRFEAMHRELGFRWDQSDANAVFLRSLGYTAEHLRALCALNSFYQIVIGPLSAASRKWRASEFDTVTIRHGQLALGPIEAARLRDMVTRFERIFGEINNGRASIRLCRGYCGEQCMRHDPQDWA
ncbi:MAG: hypothetical protein ACXW5U_17225 [Thermoanaerobaculia bacterium]